MDKLLNISLSILVLAVSALLVVATWALIEAVKLMAVCS